MSLSRSHRVFLSIPMSLPARSMFVMLLAFTATTARAPAGADPAAEGLTL
jgi:hypothetical protein